MRRTIQEIPTFDSGTYLGQTWQNVMKFEKSEEERRWTFPDSDIAAIADHFDVSFGQCLIHPDLPVITFAIKQSIFALVASSSPVESSGGSLSVILLCRASLPREHRLVHRNIQQVEVIGPLSVWISTRIGAQSVVHRLIVPERITLPDIESPAEPVKTIKPPKRKPAHFRQNSRSKPTGIDLMANNNKSDVKTRTVVSQAPSALYCSTQCREKDQRSSEKFKWSLETMYSAGGSTGPASPLFVSGSESEEWVERRLSAGTTTSSSGDESNDKAALYAGYPLTFQRRDDERSRKGSWTSLKDLGAPGTPRNSSPVPQSASSEPQNTTYSLQNSSISPQPIHNLYAADITPTQSLYSVSAQGLLVRPALLRAKTELTSLSPLDDAPRLYHPSSVPMSRNGSGTRPSSIRHASTPSAPNSPTYRKVTPSQSHSRRRSEVLSQSSLSDANRTKSSDSIKSKNFMPLYPALVMPPAPQTRMVKKWVVEEERLVEREVEEVQEQGERKRMFTFNTKMR
ncbi:hypothetical protein RhiTH_008344 [Rhizoctonia solani]